MRKTLAWIGILLALGLSQPAYAGWKEVPVEITVPPRVSSEPGQKVLVALFRTQSPEGVDAGLELSRWLRRALSKTTPLVVLGVPPPPIPEQRSDKLVLNDPFWRRLGQDFGADLIVAGIADFRSEDRSGYVSEDSVSPVTGQTIRRQRFAEMRAFSVRIEFFVFKGDNGALLFSDVWAQERVLEGGKPDDLSSFFELLENLDPNFRATFLPTQIKQPRNIWVE